MTDATPAVALTVKRVWMAVEGVASIFGVVLTGQNLAAGDWLGALLFGALTASLAFQTAQSAGRLAITEDGIVDERVAGAGEVPWSRVVEVHLSSGGLLRPPLIAHVEDRARAVAAASPWAIRIRIRGEDADWDTARRRITELAQRADVPVETR